MPFLYKILSLIADIYLVKPDPIYSHMEYYELRAPVKYPRPVEFPIRGPQSGIPQGKHFTGQAGSVEHSVIFFSKL